MRPLLANAFGNPLSGHWRGDRAHAGRGRTQRCSAVGRARWCSPAAAARPTIWRSKPSSSPDPKPAIILPRVTSSLAACRVLEGVGARVTYLRVDGTGRVDPDDGRCALTPCTIHVSVRHANSEAARFSRLRRSLGLPHAQGVLLHTDAALFLAVIEAQSGEASGMASYLNIVPANSSIEIGHIWFAPPLQKTRAATEANPMSRTCSTSSAIAAWNGSATR